MTQSGGELDDFNVEGTVWETKVEQKRRHFLSKGKCARCMFSLKRAQWAQITRECDAGLTAHRQALDMNYSWLVEKPRELSGNWGIG